MITCFPWCESKKKIYIYVERGNEKMTRTDQAGDFFDKLTILRNIFYLHL